MKKGKYTSLYVLWLAQGKMPGNGLCTSLHYPKKLDFFEPTFEESREHKVNLVYWGSGERAWRKREFTTFRQTVLLFLAAMNNEL